MKEKDLSASKDTLNYKQGGKADSQIPARGHGDIQLKTNTKGILSRMQEVLSALDSVKAVGTLPHYIWLGSSQVEGL